MANNEKYPLVSVIIPIYRSVETLKEVLSSLKVQTYKNIEVIVIDRPSNDGTKELVESFKYTYIPCESERTKAVNMGVKNSHGEYVYYIGSDYVLEDNLIETTVKTILQEKGDAAIIINTIKPTSFWSKVKMLEKETYIGDDLIEAARFFSKKAFTSVGGYNEKMVAYEEHDIHNRILGKGYTIVRVPTVKEINIGEPKSLWGYARKYYYYGKTMRHYISQYPEKSKKQLTPIRASYLKHWKKFAKHPVLTIGFIIYQFVRYMSAGLGYIDTSVTK